MIRGEFSQQILITVCMTADATWWQQQAMTTIPKVFTVLIKSMGNNKCARKLRLPSFYHICQIGRQKKFPKEARIGLAQDLKLA